MKHRHSSLRRGGRATCLLLALCLAWPAAPRVAAQDAPAATFTVNSTNDVDDGACNAAHCSLREAINAANTAAGSDTIAFNIAGAGVKTISPTSALPAINSGVAFSNASNNTVGLPNPASRNVIAGNNNTGIVFSNGSNNNSVVANYIGLNAAGTAAVPNAVAGVFVNNGAGNIIGDSSAPARNVISGNENQGVVIFGPSSGNFVRGNTIGLDPAGAVAIPNQGSGVRLASGATLNVIGGSLDAARNIISGNENEGVLIHEAGTDDNTVERNYIGVAADGVTARPNAALGVALVNAAGNQVLDNVISGNLSGGVAISAAGTDNNVLQGNKIGVAADGVTPVGNGVVPVEGGGGPGVGIFQGDGNQIGGLAAGDGNIIAYNGGNGLQIQEGVGNRIRGNSVHSNGALGIDLDYDGVTPNDPLDPDTGGNLLQNYPSLQR